MPAPMAFFADAEIAGPNFRLKPHYRAKPPLDEVIRKVQPGLDAFVSEKYAEEIEGILKDWTAAFGRTPRDLETIRKSLSPQLAAFSPGSAEERLVRSYSGLEIRRARIPSGPPLGRESFVRDLANSYGMFSRFTTAEFKVTSLRLLAASPQVIQTRIRYDLVGPGTASFLEQRVGEWELEWERSPQGDLRVRTWKGVEETRARAAGPIFSDITASVLGGNSSYAAQLLRGTDYWRSVLDAASGIDVYGSNGVAVGDIDNDGFDDLYVCQPAGLPNRLYRNRGDGTLVDVTDEAGVGVLDSTACALFADFNNDGFQDLLVVSSSGPLLFLNQKNGKFQLKSGAFRFAQPPQGTFTGAAVADYDRDGWLDVYFCLYLYYQGLDQYRFPVPYDDAQNGPPNFLFRNNGDGSFSDVTASTGMSQNNNSFSFAAGWCDYNRDGFPDVYVVNDFGRNNLYRNSEGRGFTDVAPEAGVEDIGAGMSVGWFDYDADGRQDLYVSNMWSAAGKRITPQEEFMKGAPESTRALYRKHASGNTLLRDGPSGSFIDVSSTSGTQMGRWAWSSDAWDFDHDGFPDLYVANGMISGPNTHDLGSFFWRQVVSHSPLEPIASPEYEQGWNAINELIRSDGTWSGYERNTFYVNLGDGTFADASGATGLDFADDSRAFALSDFDHDGRLEVFLKNRTAPQIRILRNEMAELRDSISFRLRGTKSNRDAIGAEVTVESGGRAQTKFLQAGSGFLSQHTKELFFGLRTTQGPVRATVRWPSGLVQQFENLPPNHRIAIEEGSASTLATAFAPRSPVAAVPVARPSTAPSASTPGTWLLEPLPAPDLPLPDVSGRVHSLKEFRGRPVLVNFWSMRAELCQRELRIFQQKQSDWARQGMRVVAINVDDPGDASAVRSFVRAMGLTFSVFLADEDTVGIYNILHRYLFDRRRDLGIPSSFLLDKDGRIIKVYPGSVDPAHLQEDGSSIPQTAADRVRKALPFAGQSYGGEFERNYFTYGAAFFQRGYFDQAAVWFELALRSNPDYAEAHYNLGIIYLRLNRQADARQHFQRAVELRSDYPDALNNLGLIAAEEGQIEPAIGYFQDAIRRRPGYTLALQNLGNLYRKQGRLAEAQQMLEKALESDREDPELNYSLGMLYAQKEDTDRAREYLQRALSLRPDYPEALNNLGVLYLRTGKTADAVAAFENCIRIAPSFDQPYLNLAQLYVGLGDRNKAREILQRLLRLQPDHALARQALEELSR